MEPSRPPSRRATALATISARRSTGSRGKLGISASALPSRPVAPDHPDLQQLSPREREVLLHIGAGHRVPGIAERLFISGHTVHNHLKAIYRKLGVESQHDLVEWLKRL